MNKVVYNADFGGFNLSGSAIKWLIAHGKTPEWCNSVDFKYEYRHDPLLVECIETLKEEANGHCADLKVAKIKGNQYIINDYDGAETVKTPSNINWITI